MLLSTPSGTSARWPAVILVALLLLGAIGIMRVTVEDIALRSAAPAGSALSVDEKTYYEFVEPRLARLVQEVDAVSEMVQGKSRDIIDLTVRGDRIETLSAEIIEHGDANGVPERFAGVHEEFRRGSTIVGATFDEARTALRTFNFSNMTTLVPQFHQAAMLLQQAHDHLVAIVGVPAAIAPRREQTAA